MLHLYHPLKWDDFFSNLQSGRERESQLFASTQWSGAENNI